MHSHLAIIGKNGELALNPDQSLTITEKNPMFNDVEMFSQTIQLPFDKNRQLLKNMDDVNSTMRATEIENERFKIVLDGIPLRTAALKVQSGVKLDGSIDVNFDATNRTFKDMIQDMRCRDVAMADRLVVGEKIADVTMDVTYLSQYKLWIEEGGATKEGYEVDLRTVHSTEVFQPIPVGFSFPGACYEDASHKAEEDPDRKANTYVSCRDKATVNITVKHPKVKTSYINVSQPYPAAKYCNTRICYAHHKPGMQSNDGTLLPTGESSDEIYTINERQRDIEMDKSPYWVLPAERPASGLCFYVAYFLECLFKHLGVAYDMTALTNIEDFNYLAFVTTQCHTTDGNELGSLANEDQINDWLESRGCGGRIKMVDNLPEEPERYTSIDLSPEEYAAWRAIGYHWQPASTNIADPDGHIRVKQGKYVPNTPIPGSETWAVFTRPVQPVYNITQQAFSAKIREMIATSDNFPDANVTEVIESLENSFGVRFCYDADINKVTVKLLRDMFRDQQAPIKFKGKVLSMIKETEYLKGIRMKYSAESDAQDQRDNIRYGKRDYDTVYDYCDYPEDRTKLSDYEDITNVVDVGNRNGYCDLRTGDFFRIKVSSEASTSAELRPAIFEVGAMHGVELGDCSKQAEDDDAIKEFVSSFTPVEVNDVGYRGKNYAEQEETLLVPFVDEDMEHEFLVKNILNPVSTKWGAIDINYELCMAECYDPTTTDDGQSPLQHHDWGLTIGFLRPGSSDEDGVVEYDYNYDGFNNSKWMVMSKNYTINADTFDHHGAFIGINPQTSFSLKPRAWKPFLYYIDLSGNIHITTDLSKAGQRVLHDRDIRWLIPCNDDVRNAQGIITERIRSRGMCDTWMIEFFRFLLGRQKYHIEALCTAAELADIPNKWLRRWEIDGKVGFINLVNYPADVQTGLGKVEIEFYAI